MKDRLHGPDWAITNNEIINEDLDQIESNLSEFALKIEGKTFVISGGAGFLGSWFSDTAIRMGGKVICVDTLIASSQETISHLLPHPNFQFVQEDITTFRFPDNADYVVHMASIASPPLYQKDPIAVLDSGVLGTRNVLEQASEKPYEKIIFTSTSEVYGDPPDEQIPTPETYYGYVPSYGPRSMYDEAKRAGEAYCWAYRADSAKKGVDLPIRIARIFNTYGPRIDIDNPSQYGRALIKFVTQALNDDPITVYGDGKQTRSFCYVTDQITGLFKLLLTDDVNGEVINIGNDTETSIGALAEMIKSVSGSNSPIVYNAQPSYNVETDPLRRCPDLTKANNMLSYNPSITLEDGIKRTIAWTKDNLRNTTSSNQG